MPPPFRQINRVQFGQMLQQFNFTRRITMVHFHHTSTPNHRQFEGHASVVAMFRHHTVNRGFRDIAQHITIAPDGTIFLGRNWNLPPASAAGHNGGVNAGPFMFETVGNFNIGSDPFQDSQKLTVLNVIALVQRKFNLPSTALRFHRELSNTDCPGSAIRKNDIIQEVTALLPPAPSADFTDLLNSDALNDNLGVEELSQTEPFDLAEVLRQFEAAGKTIAADDETSFDEEDKHDETPSETSKKSKSPIAKDDSERSQIN